LADDKTLRRLNRDFRGKDKATNVLSFPATPQAAAKRFGPLLGDIVLAEETVATIAPPDPGMLLVSPDLP